MRYLLFLIATNCFANFVSGPDATAVFTSIKECEAKEQKKCYPKTEDHTITKIVNGALVEDPLLKLAKIEKIRLAKEKNDNIELGCSEAKAALKTVKKNEEGLAAFNYIVKCLPQSEGP